MELVTAYLFQTKEIGDNDGVFIINEEEIPFTFVKISFKKEIEPMYTVGNAFPISYDTIQPVKMNLTIPVINKDIHMAINYHKPLSIRFKNIQYYVRPIQDCYEEGLDYRVYTEKSFYIDDAKHY